jgi:cytochrome d ubiquinol oxidase subunit II
MNLQNTWFVLIAVLWSGYFLLEGFDFGVGMLLPSLPRDERERGEMLETIGPVWDGNEVWLITAGGATFAAFPAWYATMFSGFYLALLLVLFFLIIRVISFEWRSKAQSARWRTLWMWANAVGSLGASLIWGVGLANLLYGVPINSSGDFAGSFWDLFSVYTVLGGVTIVLLFAFHGATYLTIRTTGDLCERAAATARRLSVAAAVVGAVFLAWTVQVATDKNDKDVFPPVLPAALGIAALVLAVLFAYRRLSGLAFAATALAAVLWVATIFTSLYPRVMVSSTGFSNSLTVDNASSAHYTLAVMSVVALIFLPLILLYQGWTYHVFRQRVGGETDPGPEPEPAPVTEAPPEAPPTIA